ncbi:MAG: biotin--[acetyl-CoA-carboxylase] ligase [Chthoniobacterales bacterium]
MSPAEPRLDADQLRIALGDCVIGREILVLDETTSTNDFVFGLTTAATREGLVVFAERQTAGRGQHGRQWESAAGKGLWFSILLRPKITPNESPRLTSWAAETIATNLSLDATVQPPNDIYIANRKVAGILLEMRAMTGEHVGILGIGVNVNHAPEDFPPELRERAGSLATTLGHYVDRQKLAATLLRALDSSYREAVAS